MNSQTVQFLVILRIFLSKSLKMINIKHWWFLKKFLYEDFCFGSFLFLLVDFQNKKIKFSRQNCLTMAGQKLFFVSCEMWVQV